MDETTKHGDAHTKRGIAVLTSGGDSQGMNAAVRAVVRVGIHMGFKVFFIKEGYQGLVDGGQYIVEAKWSSVNCIMHKGGTEIGSARCKDFMEPAGRLNAAKNLVDRGISNLVVIGGDGSLTGANLFRLEWKDLLETLVSQKSISEETRNKHRVLHIAGLVGSIDNDFCGTDMTIGTDSALYRIIEAIDAIASTAKSHQRTFIMEVMGRNCGYLAVVAALASEADYVFCPESPPPSDWEQRLCAKLEQERNSGQRLNIIIVAEGAKDREGLPITAAQVKTVIENKLKQDTRVTVLGHVQRGGNPSAFDRILGCRMGAEAVMALVEATENMEPCVIGLNGNEVVRLSLMQCVRDTTDVVEAMVKKDFERAVNLRGAAFKRHFETYKLLNRLKAPLRKEEKNPRYNLAVINIGSPASGINAAVRSFVRNAIYRGDTVYGIHDGIEGLIARNFKRMDWSDVTGWVAAGGVYLGTKRTLPGTKAKEVAEALREFNIHGLLIIGGFDAYLAAIQLTELRNLYKAFCIPIVVIPSTINNNVPGTEYTLGCETAVNEITKMCDRIIQSANGRKSRVFIVEIMGGFSGYLTTLAALAAGADAAYISEEKFDILDLKADVGHMVKKMAVDIKKGLILNNECSSKNYNTDFICRLFEEESQGAFTARKSVLGHLQQGGTPSPFDREFGTTSAAKAVEWIREILKDCTDSEGNISTTSDDSSVLLGIVKTEYKFTPVCELKKGTDFERRVPKDQWWLKLRPLLRVLNRQD